nr:MAG TPA: hypothetical protein [Caudoviricetes sp.]
MTRSFTGFQRLNFEGTKRQMHQIASNDRVREANALNDRVDVVI